MEMSCVCGGSRWTGQTIVGTLTAAASPLPARDHHDAQLEIEVETGGVSDRL
jgi:hypothetical protein